MSVRIEIVTVLVPAARIEETYPGGLAAYERDAPNTSFDCDEELTSVAFSSGSAAWSFSYDLSKSGLRIDPPWESDVAIIDADTTDTGDCPWIGLVKDEGSGALRADLVPSELPDPPEPWED